MNDELADLRKRVSRLEADVERLDRREDRSIDLTNIDRTRLLRVEKIFVADQEAFLRLADHLQRYEEHRAADAKALAVEVARLDAHLADHIRHCHTKEGS